MKKNKILIPALAVLAFSTVASVTGTVAWFSAASAVDISTSQFEITGIDGSLNYSVTAGVGVQTGSGSESKVIMPKTSGTGDNKKTATLTHASFDHSTKKVYSKSQEGSGYVLRGTIGTDTDTDNGTKFKEDASVLKYNCFSWDITFTYGTTGPTDGNRNLYFNVDSSMSKVTFKSGDTPTDGAKNAGRGFKMAFLSNDTNSSPLVWSPESGLYYATNATATTGTKQKYITGTAETNTSEYTTTSQGNLFYKGDTSVSTIVAETAGAVNRKDYMGSFTSTKNTITITIVCWFDGCDEVNVVNETVLPKVSAAMNFYMRKSS